ncbi:MAG: hypothetical protein F4Y69_12495 [Chloroflexi bacterium]|nr:hypothetical protein [Chloroflexota bacterium]MYF22652.1 hypothetical protein [Chloroflexota bacterium]
MSACSRAARPILAIALALLAGVLFLLPTTARAEGGVPIPAEAGTTWSIIAGYNTGTHSEADGNDPHAIDIVRTDAATDWTEVLSPVDGEVTWRGDECLTIRDSAGYAHLLCHISIHARFQRGVQVSIGDDLGMVYPAGLALNGGVAHIHYAIHETYGGGYLAHSIPFTGRYAIEGRELHYTTEYNLHANVEFTSTNVPGWIAPQPVVTQPPAETTEPSPNTGPHDHATQQPDPETYVDSGPAWIVPADAPVGGWRTIGVYQRTSVAGLFANLNSPLRELVVHNPFQDTFHRFDPTDEASAQIAVRSLQPGQAVWALVEPQARWLPAPPVAPQSVTIRLAAGVNMVSWQGPDRDIADALRNVDHLERAYRYDAYTDTWALYNPGAPDFLNTLDTLKAGDAFHLVVSAGSMWTQLP